MAFTLPTLPYSYDALEPHIDEATMKLHHGKHHQAYVDKLNAAIAASEWESKSLDEIMVSLDKVPDKIKADTHYADGGSVSKRGGNFNVGDKVKGAHRHKEKG